MLLTEGASLTRGQTADVLTRSACHFHGPDTPQRTGAIVSSYRTVGSKVTVNCRWPGKLRIARLCAPVSADGRNLRLRYIRHNDVFLSLAPFLSFSFSLSLSSIGDPCSCDWWRLSLNLGGRLKRSIMIGSEYSYFLFYSGRYCQILPIHVAIFQNTIWCNIES